MADLQAAYIDSLNSSATNQGKLLTEQANTAANVGVNKAAILGSTIGQVTGAIDDFATQKDKWDEDNYVKGAFAQTGGDPDKALKIIQAKYPQTAMKLGSELAKTRQEQQKAIQEETKTHESVNKYWMGILAGLDDNDQAGYDRARANIQHVAPDVASVLPQAWSKDVKRNVLQMGETAQDMLKRIDDGYKLVWSGEYQRGAGSVLSGVNDQPGWDSALKTLKLHGVPSEVLDIFGPTYSPDAAKHAGQLALTADQAADNARADVTQAATEAQHKADLQERTEHDRAMADAANLRAQRAGSAAAGGDDKVAERQAREWRAKELATLATRARGTVGSNGTKIPPIDDIDVEREKRRIETSYQQMLPGGDDAAVVDDPTFPNGVLDYVSKLKTKYQSVDKWGDPGPFDRDAALAELRTALPSLQRDHPSLDVPRVFGAFDAAPPTQTGNETAQSGQAPPRVPPPSAPSSGGAGGGPGPNAGRMPKVGDLVGQQDYPNGNGPLWGGAKPPAAAATPAPPAPTKALVTSSTSTVTLAPAAVAASLKGSKPGTYIFPATGDAWEKTANGDVIKATFPPVPDWVSKFFADKPSGSAPFSDGSTWRKLANGQVYQVK